MLRLHLLFIVEHQFAFTYMYVNFCEHLLVFAFPYTHLHSCEHQQTMPFLFLVYYMYLTVLCLWDVAFYRRLDRNHKIGGAITSNLEGLDLVFFKQ